ncbi:MAG TPA: peptidoglycan DD-metalloendopeptidase family protein [Alphaproteobacteria bacterium]|nr:peptidoglycan DD-metalloendopeptidase family protein [Alphaproteobacteria bacterium]
MTSFSRVLPARGQKESVLPRERGVGSAALALLLLAGPAAAGEPAGKGTSPSLEQVEHALEEGKTRAADLGKRSAALAGELAELRQQMIEAAKATQEEEDQLSGIEGTLAELRSSEKEKTQRLREQHGRLALTLAALERLALYPPEALAALPESPVDTVRSALLLRTAIPAVEARAARLRADLDTLRAVRQQITQERQEANAAKRQLEGNQRHLAALAERKADLYRQLEGERRGAEDRIVKLAAQAKDLRELMARIEAERQEREAALAKLKPPTPPSRAAPDGSAGQEQMASFPPGAPLPIRPISEAEGHLTLPARGKITKEFGVADAYGTTSKGLTIQTRQGAEIVAPYDGRVVYAGPFRGYGQILIIEHSEGYHSLLAGLSQIDAAAGQWVLAGEPVGAMGQQETGEPELYLELRRNGRPINPLPWLALHKGKVSG